MGTSTGYAVYDDRATFYSALAAFLEDGDNSRFVSDIVYTDNEDIKVGIHPLFVYTLLEVVLRAFVCVFVCVCARVAFCHGL